MKISLAIENFYKIAVKQNLILKNRIRLIRAMTNALSAISDNEEKEYLQNVINAIREDEFGHFLSLSLNDNNTVSYSKSEADKLNESKRVKTTLGRYLKRNWHMTIEDKTLSDFTTEVLKQLSTEESLDSQIKELSEDEIMDFYRTNDDPKTCGGLSSCMSGEVAADYTQLYALNPNKVKLITFGNRARALLWTTDDGEKVLDRYYPSASKYGELLRKWAKNKGYILRNDADGLVVSGNVELSDFKEHRITLKQNGVFPYLDTFKYGYVNEDDDTVELSNYENFGDSIFDSQDGNYKKLYCDGCDKKLSGETKILHNKVYYCQNCFNELFFECAECHEILSQDSDLNYADDAAICNDCFNKKYFRCENCGNAEENKKAISVNDNEYWCPDCVESGDVKTCDKCDDHYTTKNLTIVLDKNNNQEYYCKHDIQVANRCEECYNWFSYKLEHGYCKNCKPEYYTPQLSLPFPKK